MHRTYLGVVMPFRSGLGSSALAILLVALAACGSSESAREITSSSARPSTFASAPGQDSKRASETGVLPYDYGYNAALEDEMRTSSDCEGLANVIWEQIPDGPERESEFLAVYQGCVDGIFGRPPNATFPSDYPAGGVPYVDPCQEDNIEPWIVIYEGPGGSGDVSVGAPCQEVAEQYALDQLPPGSFIIESWRA